MNYEKNKRVRDYTILSQFYMAIDRYLQPTCDCAELQPIKLYCLLVGQHRQRQVSLDIIIMLYYYNIVDSDAVIGNGAALQVRIRITECKSIFRPLIPLLRDTQQTIQLNMCTYLLYLHIDYNIIMRVYNARVCFREYNNITICILSSNNNLILI